MTKQSEKIVVDRKNELHPVYHRRMELLYFHWSRYNKWVNDERLDERVLMLLSIKYGKSLISKGKMISRFQVLWIYQQGRIRILNVWSKCVVT